MAEDAGKEITIANDVDINIFRIGISSPGCNDPYGEGAVSISDLQTIFNNYLNGCN